MSGEKIISGTLSLTEENFAESVDALLKLAKDSALTLTIRLTRPGVYFVTFAIGGFAGISPPSGCEHRPTTSISHLSAKPSGEYVEFRRG